MNSHIPHFFTFFFFLFLFPFSNVLNSSKSDDIYNTLNIKCNGCIRNNINEGINCLRLDVYEEEGEHYTRYTESIDGKNGVVKIRVQDSNGREITGKIIMSKKDGTVIDSLVFPSEDRSSFNENWSHSIISINILGPLKDANTLCDKKQNKNENKIAQLNSQLSLLRKRLKTLNDNFIKQLEESNQKDSIHLVVVDSLNNVIIRLTEKRSDLEILKAELLSETKRMQLEIDKHEAIVEQNNNELKNYKQEILKLNTEQNALSEKIDQLVKTILDNTPTPSGHINLILSYKKNNKKFKRLKNIKDWQFCDISPKGGFHHYMKDLFLVVFANTESIKNTIIPEFNGDKLIPFKNVVEIDQDAIKNLSDIDDIRNIYIKYYYKKPDPDHILDEDLYKEIAICTIFVDKNGKPKLDGCDCKLNNRAWVNKDKVLNRRN